MMLFKLCFGGIDKIRESAVFNALRSKLVVILEVVDMDNVTVNLIADFIPQKIGIHLDLVLIVLGGRVSKLHAGQVGEIRLVQPLILTEIRDSVFCMVESGIVRCAGGLLPFGPCFVEDFFVLKQILTVINQKP